MIAAHRTAVMVAAAALAVAAPGAPAAAAPASATPAGVVQQWAPGEPSPVDDLGGVPAAPTPAEVEQYLVFVTSNMDTVWDNWFHAHGFPDPDTAVHIIGPGESFRTSCTDQNGESPVVTSDFNNLFYCPTDTGQGAHGEPAVGGIVLPVLTLQRMWTGDILGTTSQVAGDFAAAVAVAHEYGHSVVDELATAQGIAFPVGKNNELIADCLAGVWTASVQSQGLLEPGDLDEGIAALEAVGDTTMTDDPHGSPAERMQALRSGYSTGNPLTCSNTYWRT